MDLNFLPKDDKTAIYLVLDGIVKAGCSLIEVADDTWNMDERESVAGGDVTTATTLVTGVDEAYVFVKTPDGDEGWIFFVLGNDPEEVVNNHTKNLSEFIDPIVKPWWV